MRWQPCAGVVFAIVCLAGCGDDAATKPSVTSTIADADVVERSPTETPASLGSGRPSNVRLEIKDWTEIEEWISSQLGSVVVVDVWSTYCTPCLKEFPHFVRLCETYSDQISCASLSVDFYGGHGKPEDRRPQVLKFLVAQNATMQNFMSAEPDETVLARIGVAAIPAVLVYDQAGKLRKVFSNDEDEYGSDGFSYQMNVMPLVEGLLQSEQIEQ